MKKFLLIILSLTIFIITISISFYYLFFNNKNKPITTNTGQTIQNSEENNEEKKVSSWFNSSIWSSSWLNIDNSTLEWNKGIDLLWKRKIVKTDDNTKKKLYSVFETSEIKKEKKKEIKEKIEKGFHTFYINNNNWEGIHNDITKIYNNYTLNTRKINLKNFKFHSLSTKHYKWCIDEITIKPNINKITIFENLENFKLLNLIDYINNISKNNKSLLIINWINLNYNCDDVEELKRYLKDNKTENYNFENIIFLYSSKTINQNEHFSFNLNMLKEIVKDTNIRLFDIKDKYQVEDLLWENIFQFNNNVLFWKEDINTRVYFYDDKNNFVGWELIIMKKNKNNFELFQRLLINDKYYGNLNPWIYYFIAYDPINNIYLETKPTTINNNNPFSYKFTFRKSKVELYIKNRNGLPIIWNIEIEYKDKKKWYKVNYRDVSQILFDWNPWRYIIKVNIPKENAYFEEEILLNWENKVVKEFTLKEVKVFVWVYEKRTNQTKNNVAISVLKWWNILQTLNWWKNNIELPIWEYNILVKDINSWDIISKTVNIKDTSWTQPVHIYFETQNIILDLWTKPVVIEIFNKNEPKHILKRYSWTGIKRIDFMIGKYIAKIYDVDFNLQKTTEFEVSNFYQNEISLWL